MFVLKKHVSTITNKERKSPSRVPGPPTVAAANARRRTVCRGKIMALPWVFLHLGVGKNHEKTMVCPSETLQIMGSSHIYMTLCYFSLQGKQQRWWFNKNLTAKDVDSQTIMGL